MSRLIQQTLQHCGYSEEPTEDNLIELFLHYVDQGAFNLTLEEAEDMLNDGELTIEQICRNLLKR